MEYTVDYFISKFSAIPESKWVTGKFKDDEGRRCANGHCGCERHGRAPEAIALAKLLSPLVRTMRYEFTKYGDFSMDVTARINDNQIKEYQQPTPKQRILAALHDIKKLSKEQDVHECDATKPIVAPSVWPNKTKSLCELIPIVEEVSDTPIKEFNQISQ